MTPMPHVRQPELVVHRVPLPQYATNAQLPYPNDWGAHIKRREVTATDLATAREAAEKQGALRSSRRLRRTFFAAIVQRDVATVKQLLQIVPTLLDRHSPSPWRATPLCGACAVGDLQVVTLLLERGADIVAGDSIGATPLVLAAAKGAIEVIKLLLGSKQGGNAGRAYLLNQCTKGGESAVMAAAKHGHTDTLAALLSAGALCTATTTEGNSALMLACKHDKVECAKLLLQQPGTRQDQVDKDGRTALMHAAAGGSTAALKLLLDTSKPGVDLGQPDMSGMTALEHAIVAGSVPCAEALLAHGAALPSPKQQAVLSPHLLNLAAKAGQGEMVAWLLNKGVGLSTLTEPGPSHPLFAAVRGGSGKAVDALLAAGARLQIRDHKGRTPLALAAQLGKHGLAKLLVAKGASLLDMDVQGRVPRQLAQRHNQRNTAEALSYLARAKLLLPESAVDAQEACVASL